MNTALLAARADIQRLERDLREIRRENEDLRTSIYRCQHVLHYSECDGMHVCVCDVNDRHKDIRP